MINSSILLKIFSIMVLGALLFLPVLTQDKTGPGIECEDCNVVLVSVEPLRADRMDVYGHERSTMPELNSFSKDAFVFDRAFTQSHHTTIALFSTMTSLYPSQHGVSPGNAREQGFSEEFVTLAETFSQNGYHTFGLNFRSNRKDELGFSRGFAEHRKDDGNATRFMRENIEQSGERPFFMSYPSFRPHSPYWDNERHFRNNTSEQYRRVAAKTVAQDLDIGDTGGVRGLEGYYFSQLENNESLQKVALDHYDGSLRHVDGEFGLILETLEDEGELNNTVIVFTSQHGEAFGEHVRWSHESLFNEVMRVPLIMKVPGYQGERISRPVELIDLGPTLLDIVGVESTRFQEQAEGISLASMMAGNGYEKQYIYAESRPEKAFINISTGLKYVESDRVDISRVYNISRDFEETMPLEDPELRDRMQKQMEQFRSERSSNSEYGNVFPYYAD